MAIKIGSARVDERGTYSNGQPGDQKQVSTPDYKGEVSEQSFYVHSKGWIIIRAKNAQHAIDIAKNMKTACNNQNIGYSQSDRLGVVRKGVNAVNPTNCDCSSLVRECVKEATGKDPGNFTTANEPSKLVATGLFDRYEYNDGNILYTGDILCTKVKGHTVVVTEGEARIKAVDDKVIADVLAGKYGNGAERKRRLAEAGYDYVKVQAAINAALQKEVPAQHIDQRVIDLIKRFEGCRLKAYRLDNESQWSIGYGHSSSDIHPNMTITQEQADEMLRNDLVRYEGYVKKYVTDIVLTQNRLSSLTSYCYNRGIKGIKQLAENSHTVEEYGNNFIVFWGSNKKYKDALIKRRKAERELFLS